MVLTTIKTIEGTKSEAVDLLGSALNNAGNINLEFPFHATLGFNYVMNDVELELVEPRYGKVTDFDYEPIGIKNDFTIIMYYQPGCNIYGYGVLSDEGDVCLEITTYDLVEWIVPAGSPDDKLEERFALLTSIIIKAQHKPSN